MCDAQRVDGWARPSIVAVARFLQNASQRRNDNRGGGMKKLCVVLGISILAAIAGTTARLQAADNMDPLSLYPDNYRVLFENDRVRVLDFRLAKGAHEETHRHPAHVAVFLGEFKIRFTLPDGTTGIRDAHFGDVAYSDGAVHASQNIGDNDAHGILIELK
jgi:hypothetical protein